VIWAGGERLPPGPGADPLEGAQAFLASRSLAESSQLEAIAALVDGRPALAWLAEGSPPRLTTLLHDDGKVLEDVDFPGGLAIAAGTPIELGEDAAQVGAARIALAGPQAGILSYTPAQGLDPWIRYFYATSPAGEPPPLAGIRLRLFAQPGPAEAQVDPARPLDPRRTHALPVGAQSVVSNLRTRWAGKIAIAPQPPDSRYVLAYDPERAEHYWTLDGVWRWSAEGAEQTALLLGLSGAEYVQAPDSFSLSFVAEGPAFAPSFSPKGLAGDAGAEAPLPLQSSIPGILEPVTTAWLYVTPPLGAPASAEYFSQPDLAGLFTAGERDPFLHALTLAAAPLPPQATTPYTSRASFPMAPYAGLEGGSQSEDVVRRFEINVLVASRAQVIYGLQPEDDPLRASASAKPPGPSGLAGQPSTWPFDAVVATGPTAPTGPSGPVKTAVTGQGLLSTLSLDFHDWRSLVLAQTGDGAQSVVLTRIRDKLREALLANRLFLVVSDVERLRRHCSTTFAITSTVLELAKSSKLPDQAIAAVARLQGRVYETDAYFEAGLEQVLQGAYPDAKEFFLTYGELAQLNIGGWSFDLAAWRWKDASAPTILIVKFVQGDLESLVADRSRWTLPSEFNDDDGAQAQEQLLAIVHDARRRAAIEPDLTYFVETVLAGAQDGAPDGWNGVLFLNPVVPTPALPPELGALAAGLPSGEVRAHHLGVTLSSFELAGATIALDDSSLFGLLLYEDETDLVYSGSAYDFKVLSLKVRFANTTVASFSSQVELLVGQLFNELSTLCESMRGDNVLLNGTLEQGAYRFTSFALNHFTIDSQVLDFVEIAHAELVTVLAQSTASHTVARFLFNGTLGFRSLQEADLFGYGPATAGEDRGLAYAGLMVSMEFDPDDPQATRTLGFLSGQTTFDISASAARSASLPLRLPLSPTALHQSERNPAERAPTPADLGFIPVEAPVPMGSLGDVWFGLELALNFGSPGALAPTLGFTGALLLSWAPSPEKPNVAVGLRLPGSSGSSRSLTIMGPLRLDIGRLNLLHGDGEYLLRLANIALAFLGLRFPSGGRTNALLFGNPDVNAGGAALGWYAAYAKDADKDGEKQEANS
jgi:hypothetical protein